MSRVTSMFSSPSNSLTLVSWRRVNYKGMQSIHDLLWTNLEFLKLILDLSLATLVGGNVECRALSAVLLVTVVPEP